MENTLENKAKFFAQYWGQKIVINTNFDYCELVEIQRATFYEECLPHCILELKPLSMISDEDAFNVGCMANCWAKWERKKEWFKSEEMKDTHVMAGQMFAKACGKEYGAGMSHPFHDNNSTDILTAYDYLRSEGYALPYMGLSVETMIEYGWIKLK